jgi:dTDP-4-dehydrorhamnose 3,5-epimerase
MQDKIRGLDELIANQSAVNATGQLRTPAIGGVLFVRPVRLRMKMGRHGSRQASWQELAAPIVQVHITTILPGRVRGGASTSTAPTGCLSYRVSFDSRSSTAGSRRRPSGGFSSEVSEKNPGLLIIEPHQYHGLKNIGASEATLINMPDACTIMMRLTASCFPGTGEAAKRLIPYQW